MALIEKRRENFKGPLYQSPEENWMIALNDSEEAIRLIWIHRKASIDYASLIRDSLLIIIVEGMLESIFTGEKKVISHVFSFLFNQKIIMQVQYLNFSVINVIISGQI